MSLSHWKDISQISNATVENVFAIKDVKAIISFRTELHGTAASGIDKYSDQWRAHFEQQPIWGQKGVRRAMRDTPWRQRGGIYPYPRGVLNTILHSGMFPVVTFSVWFSHNADFHDDVTRPFLAPVRLWTTETLGPLHTYPNRYDSYSRKHPKIWNNTYWVAYSRHFQKKIWRPARHFIHATRYTSFRVPAYYTIYFWVLVNYSRANVYRGIWKTGVNILLALPFALTTKQK